MAQSAIQLTHSKYYSSSFNAAVFDGPVRIYFAQHQEPLALKVYHRLQEHLKQLYTNYRRELKEQGRTVFLMLYPTPECCSGLFSESTENVNVAADKLGDDYVLGVPGPLADDNYEDVFKKVASVLKATG